MDPEPAGDLMFTLCKQTKVFKNYKAVVPIGHGLEADSMLFLNNMVPSVGELVESEIKNNGQKVLLLIVAEMEKSVYSAKDVYDYSRENHIVKLTVYLLIEAVPFIDKNDIKGMI